MATCDICGKDHGEKHLIGTKVSPDELTSIKLIFNKIDCAKQAISPSALSNCTDIGQAKLFIDTTIELLAMYQDMQQEWWSNATKKYIVGTPFENKNVYVDFNTGDLYIMSENN